MAQVASRERRSSTSSTGSNSSSGGSRSPRVQYRSFWAILEPLPPRSPTRTSSHSTLPKSPSLSSTKQAHRQHTKTPPTTPTKSLAKPTNADFFTAGVEDHARKVLEHEQKFQQLMGPTKSLIIQVHTLPKGRVIIHCLRHAQAQHNIATIPRPQRLAILDPPLTSHGRVQATQLRKTLGASQKVTHVLCSPLRRTLQTALIGLSPMLSSEQKVIAYPDLREWGSSPCSTGSKMRDLLLEMKEKQENVDFTLVERGWEVNREDRGSLARRERVRRVREDLFRLGQESLKEGGTWKGKDVGRGFESGRNVEIVIVSHAAFLGTLEGTDIERLRNAQWRTYEFASEEEIRTKNYSPCSLVETRESKKRNDPVVSPSKDPPPSPRKSTSEKSRDTSKPFILDEAALIARKLNVENGKENVNPYSSKDDALLKKKDGDLEILEGKLRPYLEETNLGSNKLNAIALDKLEIAQKSSLSLTPTDKLEPPLKVSTCLKEVLKVKSTVQIPANGIALSVPDQLQPKEGTGNHTVAEENSTSLKKIELEILKPSPVVVPHIQVASKKDTENESKSKPTVTTTTPETVALLTDVGVPLTLKKSEVEKPKPAILVGEPTSSSSSKIIDEEQIKASLLSHPSSVPVEILSTTQGQDAKPAKLSSTIGDILPSPKKTQADGLKDKQKSRRSSSSEAIQTDAKSSRARNLKAPSSAVEGNVGSTAKLQITTPNETLKSTIETDTPGQDKIHHRKSKDKLKSSRSPSADDNPPSPKRLHRKKSKELLQSLPEEASTPLSPKRSHSEKSKDKLQTSVEAPSSPKKLHSEKSKDKLKSSRSRSSTPDEVPLTLRRLFAEMSREKSKRSPSPEPVSTSSSPKKLHSERSKDKLKGQKRNLLG